MTMQAGYSHRMAAFGLPQDTQAFGYMRIVGWIAALAGFVLLKSGGEPSTGNTLLIVGGIVGLLGWVLARKQSRDDFERHLADYEAGRRDDLPDSR